MKIIQYEKGMVLPETCIIADMPNEAYHATSHLSKSKLDLFNRSPAHLHCAEHRPPTRAMEIGTAIHTAILEPHIFKRDYMLLTDTPDRRQSAYREAVKLYGSERVLVQNEVQAVAGMQETALANKQFAEYQKNALGFELSFFGICSITKKPIKCRFDLLTKDGHALDLKKTQDVRIPELERTILNYRYHVQQAFYAHVYECVTGEKLKSFKFFFVEEKAPHANIIADTCFETQLLAQQQMADDLAHYEKHEPTDGIWRDETVLSLPQWYLNQNALEEFSNE